MTKYKQPNTTNWDRNVIKIIMNWQIISVKFQLYKWKLHRFSFAAHSVKCPRNSFVTTYFQKHFKRQIRIQCCRWCIRNWWVDLHNLSHFNTYYSFLLMRILSWCWRKLNIDEFDTGRRNCRLWCEIELSKINWMN